MSNTLGNMYALTVVTPVLPGQLSALRDELDSWQDAAGSPFSRTPRTHYARFVLIPKLVFQKDQPERDILGSERLLFESNFDDTDLDSYLEELLTQMPEEMDRVYSHCAGWPGIDNPVECKEYLKHNQIPATVFVAAYPDANVSEVRRALDLRSKFTSFAIEAQRDDPATLHERFRKTFLASSQ